MKTGSFSRMAARCAACEFRNDCENKRLEACAYLIEPSAATSATSAMTMPIAAEIAVKHDYRNIKVDGMTFSIDLEDIKKQMERDLHKGLYCGLNYGA